MLTPILPSLNQVKVIDLDSSVHLPIRLFPPDSLHSLGAQTQAPNPAEGLDPKVVEVYTKFDITPSQNSRQCADYLTCIFYIPQEQSRPPSSKLPLRPASEAVQNYPHITRLGAYPRIDSPGKLVTAGMPRCHAHLHLKYESCPGPGVP